MRALTLLVLANPTDPVLGALERLPEDTRIACGNRVQAFQSAAPEADAIFTWFAPRELLEQVWAIAPRVRWVHAGSVGVDKLLFPALVDSPAVLTNARGAYSAALAEFALGAMLFFAKDFRRMVRNQQAGVWERFELEELAGKTLGLVGYGDIGREVARRARAFGVRIIALRRRPNQGHDDPLLEKVLPPEARGELMEDSDYVVACAPLTPETRGLIAEAELRAMKKTGVLINIGRGPLVDEAALIRALQQRAIRGAALDVFDTEPLPAGHPFYRLDNVLLSPHCADHTPGWKERSLDIFLDNFERFRRGQPLRNVVDKRLGY